MVQPEGHQVQGRGEPLRLVADEEADMPGLVRQNRGVPVLAEALEGDGWSRPDLAQREVDRQAGRLVADRLGGADGLDRDEQVILPDPLGGGVHPLLFPQCCSRLQRPVGGDADEAVGVGPGDGPVDLREGVEEAGGEQGQPHHSGAQHGPQGQPDPVPGERTAHDAHQRRH